MENCNRSELSDRLWPYLLGTAAGTLLTALVACGPGNHGASAVGEMFGEIVLRAIALVLLLWIVPALWARLAHRVSPWVLLALAAFAFGCGILFSGDAMTALYATLLIALPGAGLFGLQKLRLSNFRTVLYESFVILAALFGFLCLDNMIRFGDAYRSFRNVIGLYGKVLAEWNALLEELGGTQISSVIAELIAEIRQYPEVIFMPMLLIAAMTAGLSGTLFSHLFNRNGGAALSPLPPFELWRCERWYVLLSVGLTFVTMLLSILQSPSAEALSGVASVLWRIPCSLAGLCTVRYLGQQTGRKWIFWIAVGLLIVLPSAAVMLLALIGMLSAMRKPTNVGEDGIRK